SSARSMVEVKKPVPSMTSSGASGMSSPTEDSSTTCTSSSGSIAPQSARRWSVCQRARALARVPILTGGICHLTVGTPCPLEICDHARSSSCTALQCTDRVLHEAIHDAAGEVFEHVQVERAAGEGFLDFLAADVLGAAADLGDQRPGRIFARPRA